MSFTYYDNILTCTRNDVGFARMKCSSIRIRADQNKLSPALRVKRWNTIEPSASRWIRTSGVYHITSQPTYWYHWRFSFFQVTKTCVSSFDFLSITRMATCKQSNEISARRQSSLTHTIPAPYWRTPDPLPWSPVTSWKIKSQTGVSGFWAHCHSQLNLEKNKIPEVERAAVAQQQPLSWSSKYENMKQRKLLHVFWWVSKYLRKICWQTQNYTYEKEEEKK